MKKLEKLMLVAFVTNHAANGGVNSLFELVSRLDGVTCKLITQSDHAIFDRWRRSGIEVEVIDQNPVDNARSPVALFPTRSREIRRVIRQFQPEVVLCNDIRATLNAGPVTRWCRIPLVFFVRDIFEPQKPYGLKWKFAASLASETFCISNEMAKQLGSRLSTLAGRSSDPQPVYSVIDFDRMTPADPTVRVDLRRERKIPEDQFAIAYAAGFCDKKNQLELIRHLPRLFAVVPNAHIHFLGDFLPNQDSYSQECLDLSVGLGLENQLTFHGFVSDIENWYRSVDCTLLASKREGLARCMIESLACGSPVVSFDVTSAREILEQYQCGAVAEQGNYDQLFEQLIQYHGQKLLLSDARQSGLNITRQLFDGSQNANQFREMLQALL